VNFKEYTFLKEQSEAHGLTKEIEEYIDNKLSNIEGRLKEIDKFGKYNVIPAGKGLLDVVNIDTHAIEAKLSYEGEIISSLVVHGDKVSFAVQKGGDIEDQHEVIGLIYEIPSGQNIGNFNVPQEDPGEKYRTTVGTITQEEPDFSDELDMQDKSDEEEELSDVRPDGEDDEQRHKDEMEKMARDQELEDLRKEVERQKKEVQAITPPTPGAEPSKYPGVSPGQGDKPALPPTHRPPTARRPNKRRVTPVFDDEGQGRLDL